MSKSKKIFLIAFVIFMILVVLAMIDFASRTRPPWKKQETTQPVTP